MATSYMPKQQVLVCPVPHRAAVRSLDYNVGPASGTSTVLHGRSLLGAHADECVQASPGQGEYSTIAGIDNSGRSLPGGYSNKPLSASQLAAIQAKDAKVQQTTSNAATVAAPAGSASDGASQQVCTTVIPCTPFPALSDHLWKYACVLCISLCLVVGDTSPTVITWPVTAMCHTPHPTGFCMSHAGWVHQASRQASLLRIMQPMPTLTAVPGGAYDAVHFRLCEHATPP